VGSQKPAQNKRSYRFLFRAALTWVLNSVSLKAYDEFQTRMQANGKDPAKELQQLLVGVSTPESVDHAAQAVDQFKKDMTAAIANWRQQ
jgi:hypothetical protein